MKRYRLLIVNSVLLLTLFGSAWGHRVEDVNVAQTDFLRPLRLPFRDWTAKDITFSKGDLDLLQPDAVLARRYEAPDGQWAELTVVAGHRKQSVHTPGYCLPGGGWEFESQRDHEIPLPDRRVPAVRAVMVREGYRSVATYFFTDGDYSTRSVVRLQGAQLLKRFRAEIPLGALVRIIVPVRGEVTEAEQFSDEFARTTVPPVLAALRSTRLTVR